MARYSRMQGAPDRKLDTTPIEMPLGACRPTPLQDIVARMVREAIAVEAGEEPETWEESNDFEEEDPDILDFSPYELQELPDEAVDPTHNPDYQTKDFVLSDGAEAVSEAPQEKPGDTPDPNESEPVKP